MFLLLSLLWTSVMGGIIQILLCFENKVDLKSNKKELP